MTTSIDHDISVLSLHEAIIHGTATSPIGVANVEIYGQGNGDADFVDLGPATINGDGTWTYDAYLPDSGQFLRAVATDNAGNKETSSDQFGVFSASPLPSQIDTVSFGENSESITTYGPRGRALYDADIQFGDGGGSPSVEAVGRGGQGIHYSTLEVSETFDNFRIGGPHHDTLHIIGSEFASFAQLLQHTTTNGGNAVIHINDQTAITLQGVTKQEIAAHHQDFVLTPPTVS